MSTTTLANLISAETQAQILQLELTEAQSLGLPITSWQPLDPSRTILQINAYIASTFSIQIAFLAQGAYASYAALMVDVNGNPVTTWMDLRGLDQYNVQRIQATAAAGPVPVQNVSANAYPYSPNAPLHFQNSSTGATYTSQGSGTIAASSSPPTPQASSVTVSADPVWVGNAGTSAAGVVLTLMTPLAGVTVQALTGNGLVGANAETNGHYLSRCQAKLGSLSPNGAPGAYVYVAESVPVFGTILSSGILFSAPTAQNPYGVSTPITRCNPVLQIGGGYVNVYVANAAGPPTGSVANPITNVSWSSGGGGVATVTTQNGVGIGIGSTGFALLSGIGGASGANNTVAQTSAWPITVTGSNTFTFPLASNPGAYTSGGVAEIGDLGMVDAAIQAQTVPNGFTAFTQAAGAATINVTATVYLKAASGIGSTAATTAISNALATYFGNIPVGGVNAEATNIVPWSEILATIAGANNGTVSVVLSVPAADVSLLVSQVPVLGTLNLTVSYV